MISEAPFRIKGRKAMLLAGEEFSPLGSKTAACFLRYREEDVVAVINPEQSGKTAVEAIGYGGNIPVVESVQEALALQPEIALVGVAPRGGGLDALFRTQVIECIQAGLDIISGLHIFLEDDPEIRNALTRSPSKIWDVRSVPEFHTIGTGRGCITGAKTVLTVGTDCGAGKMTVTYEIYLEAVRRGLNAAWAATGQTGMILQERGVAIDRVISDFVGGAAEELVNFEGRGKDVVFVEGQGSLIHPGYAGVTLGLMFGVMPDCMVLVHDVERRKVRDYEVEIPPLSRMIRLHQEVMVLLKKSPVVAVALNTGSLDDVEAQATMKSIFRQTGLPVGDPIRYGASELLDAIIEALKL